MRPISPSFAWIGCMLVAGCWGQVPPADLLPGAQLMTPNTAMELPSPGMVTSDALVGHLAGVGAPLGSQVTRATYSTERTEVVLSDVTCGARLDAAYAALTAPPELSQTCSEGVLTLAAGSKTALPSWNPWSQDHWHVGPFVVLPKVDTGETFSPHVLRFEGRKAEARLTPKKPNRVVDLVGAGLADSDWVPRPVPGGTVYMKAGWSVQVQQDGAVVTISLEGPSPDEGG